MSRLSCVLVVEEKNEDDSSRIESRDQRGALPNLSHSSGLIEPESSRRLMAIVVCTLFSHHHFILASSQQPFIVLVVVAAIVVFVSVVAKRCGGR